MSEDEFPGSNGEANDNPAEVDELVRLKEEVAELKDRLLRALAETENTRRRAERDCLDAS